jgi:multiple sugar transport system permease protein
VTLSSAPQARTSPRFRRSLGVILTYTALIIAALAFATPVFWLITSSLKPDQEILLSPLSWLPHTWTWTNYTRALQYIPFGTYILNTLYICVFNVAASCLACSFIAYGFSKIQWPARNALFIVMIATMTIPYPTTMIPEFLIFRKLGWINTFGPLTWPSLGGTAFFIFLLRQFYGTLPDELFDAARIDGCSEYRIYWQIVLPLSKPALITVAMLSFVWNWNDFLRPLLYLNTPELFTVSLGLQRFLSLRHSEWALLMAAATLATLPTLIIFMIAQKHLVSGIVAHYDE